MHSCKDSSDRLDRKRTTLLFLGLAMAHCSGMFVGFRVSKDVMRTLHHRTRG